ncbi:MMPL family transporter [Kitasatospora atroaurantiaca]|uniref:RND superfamily putative drug exporter n=1 Tax=Kitasatospora atroaurantiaca TaxID=285545 RepID=A0A561ENR2_9ACTN|nr:MMPL family transporter [Kitasatospora atroaurantiaca]TWE17258.1 RND superfamily putative drug exporter [Kitasatospora atroaurantiaca]
MIASIGRFAAAHRRWVIIGAVLFTLVAGGWGTTVFGAITGGAGFDDPASQSSKADKVLAGPLGRQADDVVVLYRSTDRPVTDPALAGPIQSAVAAVPRTDLDRVDTYWSTGNNPDFLSKDGHSTYVALQFKSSDDQERVKALQAIEEKFKVPGTEVRFGGITAMTEQVNGLTGKDIGRAEMLSVPLLLILLVFIFRSAVAASLPLAVGAVVALGSFAVLRVLTLFVDISSSVINVITILGLGLAIDYALFMVNRFREELAAGASVDLAVERTSATAGRTVAFSGLAVAISFASLTLFPSRFLSSMGYAAVSVVAFAVIGSLTLLPALLHLTGHRINSWRVPMPWDRRNAPPRLEIEGRWYRTAKAVMRRPLLTTLAVVALLIGLGAPFLGVNWARPGDWVLPSSSDARVVTQQLGTDFRQDPTKTITAVVALPGPASGSTGPLGEYAARLDSVPGVTGATVTNTQDNLARITAHYSMDPMSRDARTMVDELRSQTPPDGATAQFTGMPASRVDIVDMIGARVPWMALFVAVVSSLVLFLAFGSVTIPLKSVLLNLLSLSAAFGAIKLIFQDGHLHDLLGFTPIGAIDANFPVLIVAIAFGLAMDYEVFLLSRIKESYDRNNDPGESIALGLQRTGKIITSAALLLVVVVCGFLTSSIAFMQMIGVGLVIAIVVDATLVRAVLVPATMKLLGHRAWWAPAPLKRIWRRVNLAHGDEVSTPTAALVEEPVNG